MNKKRRFRNRDKLVVLLLSFVVVIFVVFSLVHGQRVINAFVVAEPGSISDVSVVSGEGSEGEIAQDHILVKFGDRSNIVTRFFVKFKYDLKEGGDIEGIGVKVINIPKDKTPEEVVDILNSVEKNVEEAFVDSIIYPAFTPDDPKYTSAWHLSKINVSSAWDISKGEGVVIAIIDSGTDCNHQDLKLNCISGWNVVQNNNDTGPISSHGTMTAGVAGAVGNNGLGALGVAPEAKIMPVVVARSSTGGTTLSSLLAGISWAANNNAKIVSVSYQATSTFLQYSGEYVRSKGGVLVLGAGNTNSQWDTASINFDQIVVVSGTTPTDSKASTSSYGPQIDVTAPATSVFTTLPGNGYTSGTGTSFSTSIVAGVFALIFSANPDLTNIEAQEILFNSADDVGIKGWDKYFGWGRVNAGRAVEMALPADIISPSPPKNLIVVVSGKSVLLSWDASTDNVGVKGYAIYKNENNLANVTGTSYADSSIIEGESYNYYVQAFDQEGNQEKSSVQTVTVPEKEKSDKEELQNLNATLAEDNSILVSWDYLDDDRVFGYNVYRNFELISTTKTNYYSDKSIEQKGYYTYQVVALDIQGNELAQSMQGVEVQQIKDVESPSTPKNLLIDVINENQVVLSWDSSTDDVGIEGYQVYRVSSIIAVVNETRYIDTNPLEGYRYSYSIRAIDTSGNLSKGIASVIADLSRFGGGGGLSVPGNFVAISKTSNSVFLSWETPAGNSKIEGYKVYRDGMKIASLTETSYMDNTVKPGTTYKYHVIAFDLEGREANTLGYSVTTLEQKLIIELAYVSTKTSSSAIVKWYTNLNSTGDIYYGVRPDTLDLKVSKESPNTFQSAFLGGLESNTTYYYKIITTAEGSVAEKTSSFKTLN